MWNGKGASGRAQTAWLLFGCGAMAACGGRSTSSDPLQNPDDTTSGAQASSGGASSGGASSGGRTSAPSGSRGGFGGGPSLSQLTSACTDVCSRAEDAACPGAELGDCVGSCASIVVIAEQTAPCATTTINYLDCVDDLDDICPAFIGASSPCDAGLSATTACVAAFCVAQPDNEVCQFQ